MDIGIIAAISDNGFIGKGGKLPWYIPEDLRHFKILTSGNPIIMGRKTYDSIGKPLPNRKNIVLSRNNFFAEGICSCSSLHEAIESIKGFDKAYVIGGREIYSLFLPYCNFMDITEIHRDIEGDVGFPSVNWNDWKENNRDDKEGFSFVHYERTN